jgi:hypothetical protein
MQLGTLASRFTLFSSLTLFVTYPLLRDPRVRLCYFVTIFAADILSKRSHTRTTMTCSPGTTICA